MQNKSVLVFIGQAAEHLCRNGTRYLHRVIVTRWHCCDIPPNAVEQAISIDFCQGTRHFQDARNAMEAIDCCGCHMRANHFVGSFEIKSSDLDLRSNIKGDRQCSDKNRTDTGHSTYRCNQVDDIRASSDNKIIHLVEYNDTRTILEAFENIVLVKRSRTGCKGKSGKHAFRGHNTIKDQPNNFLVPSKCISNYSRLSNTCMPTQVNRRHTGCKKLSQAVSDRWHSFRDLLDGFSWEGCDFHYNLLECICCTHLGIGVDNTKV